MKPQLIELMSLVLIQREYKDANVWGIPIAVSTCMNSHRTTAVDMQRG